MFTDNTSFYYDLLLYCILFQLCTSRAPYGTLALIEPRTPQTIYCIYKLDCAVRKNWNFKAFFKVNKCLLCKLVEWLNRPPAKRYTQILSSHANNFIELIYSQHSARLEGQFIGVKSPVSWTFASEAVDPWFDFRNSNDWYSHVPAGQDCVKTKLAC